jgi:hypothetical protein
MMPATAKVSAEKAAELDGPKYTCIGAERAGDDAAGYPAFTGKFQGTWPGVTKPYGYEPGPYANEKPLFTIGPDTMDKYAARLTEGEKALFKRYPQVYRMNVYTTHRDFKDMDWVCQRTKKNATTSELVHDGKGVTGITGGIPFPFPQSGLEAIVNVGHAAHMLTEKAVVDIADVYADGNVSWGRNKHMVYTPGNDPEKEGSYQDKFNSYFFQGFSKPERQRGFVAVGYQPNDFSVDATQSWQYLPGTRRVRQAPEVGFDYPVPPASFRTVDDDYGFNGSPERYTWKLVGKQLLYLPYDNFKVNDPSIKYKDLIRTGTINPDFVRYELRRVWVVEGTLKPGLRHIYARRVLYVDEDSWLALTADNYDAQGKIYRVVVPFFHYSQEGHGWHRGASLYQDLAGGTYEAGYLTNERANDDPDWWRMNTPMNPSMFTPEAAARAGH